MILNQFKLIADRSVEIYFFSERPLLRDKRIPFFTAVATIALYFFMLVDSSARNPKGFYTESGTDKTFAEIMKGKELPTGRDSTKGFKGSVVELNHKLLQDGPNASNRIPTDIFIHTVGNSLIWRNHFSNWSRWYQEDGNTQIFRLFKGETNVRNSRPFAARIEAFSKVKWEKGDWHEWVGTFTILKPHRMIIFQARNEVNDWSVQLNISDDGDVILNRREGEDETIADDMVGKPFHIRVRDNGHEYEVFLDDKMVGDGSFARPKGGSVFRWGLYRGSLAMTHDAMILVTGAAIDPKDKQGEKEKVAAVITKDTGEPEEKLPAGEPITERTWTNKQGNKVTAAGIYQEGEDFFWMETKGKWVAYPLADLSEADQAVLRLLGTPAAP